MKNVSTKKLNKSDSPKTPGGISKSLLTPCRQVGLSRNWKRQGPSPFISPLVCNAEEKSSKEENVDTRKRKERTVEEGPDSPECSNSASLTNVDVDNISKTPNKDVDVPRKKSKKLLSLLNNSQEDLKAESGVRKDNVNNEKDDVPNVEHFENQEIAQVFTPVLSKSKTKKKSLVKSNNIVSRNQMNNLQSQISKETELKKNIIQSTPNIKNEENSIKTQLKVPNDLAKECIVVIQKKIFKKDLEKQSDNCNEKVTTRNLKEGKPNSQFLFDSDSDNDPLISKNKSKPTSDDEDFIPTSKIRKTNSKMFKKTKTTSRIHASKIDVTIGKLKENQTEQLPSSQSSLDDDDFEHKRTILIHKTYDKVRKPVKAKSTGSVTEKDIEELQARIKAKKKILLTKAMTEDTKEIRDLIKKWQKGCQDALMQLMDLMNSKMTDKKNMDYSEMLGMLKIPANLVGYDEENDCFKTPDDTNIILANI